MLVFTHSDVKVETVSSSLDLGHVFVLDAGTELYLWYGNKSTLMERSKGQLIAEKIRKIERKSQTTILIFRPVCSFASHSLSLSL